MDNENKTDSSNAEHKKPKLRTERVFLILVLLAVIAYGVYYFAGPGNKPINVPVTPVNPNQNLEVAAMVNGEPVLMSSINRQLERVPASYNGSITAEMLLNQTIRETLIKQEAKKIGIVISNASVLAYINETLAQQQLSQEGLMKELATQNYTWDEFVDEVHKQMIIVEYINQTVLSKINITEAEITNYYNASQYPAQNVSLADVHDYIKQGLLTNRAQPLFSGQLQTLLMVSNITVYMK